MTTMRAVRFSAFGPPSVLSVQEIAKPVPRAGEALVKVGASAINPSDVKFVSGVFNPTLPRTPGRDFAGTVVTASSPWAGKSVWGNGAGFGIDRDGSHAQFVAVPEDWLSQIPANLSVEQAATVGVPFVTAWSALVVAGDIRAGETVLITGASGAVGRAATQIAHWKKARVIGADINMSQDSEADVFINTKTKDLPAMVAALTDNKGVNLVLDAVGGPVFEPAMKSMGLGGRQVAITSVGSRRVEFDLMDFYHNRQRLIGVDTAKLTGVEIAAILNALRLGFESGALRPSPVKTWPLNDVVKAYEAVAAGDASAKHILNPQSA
ncbi:zinc-binding alcohol dehydrogenase family protein [Mesorhizobium sp. CA5]|uniref:quinone oxidoreductase family protein n=1 Tax=Mesorhizobium sp. CA5 TaxID=2876638 RepID=UPI001CD17AD6|nr:zinc-binding alcohol dehydrogenase family protein [Mesorhizobium sp. CA5]MBZ9844045.1 zinc-binding alcohol dehydrogenase family protein [Mesorhizobium sp. CA5]